MTIPPHPPASHYTYFTSPCKCRLPPGVTTTCVLVRSSHHGLGKTFFYSYRCVLCGDLITKYIPKRFIKKESFLDLDGWAPGYADRGTPEFYAARFKQIPGQLATMLRTAAGIGELAPTSEVVPREAVAHIFVDESGDDTLLGRRFKVLIGKNGCSNSFIMGAARMADPGGASVLESLRADLLARPEVQGVPSLERTARAFHACKDLQPVREAVFAAIAKLDVSFYVILRRKHNVLHEYRQHQDLHGQFPPKNTLYDKLVTALFKDRLHIARENHIVFAKRGQKDRDKMLSEALNLAKLNFEKQWGVTSPAGFAVTSAAPHEQLGLQVIDYALWAVYQLFESRRDWAFNMIASKFGVIVDYDDRRVLKSGRYYTRDDPPTLQKIKPFEG